jgi:hypothetical protein
MERDGTTGRKGKTQEREEQAPKLARISSQTPGGHDEITTSLPEQEYTDDVQKHLWITEFRERLERN